MSLDARRIYFVLVTWRAFAFSLMVTVNLIWQAQVAQLSPLQLVLVGVTLEAVTFLGEVPTGVLADLYGRRLSVIIGFFLVGVGWIMEGLFPVFAVILGAQVVWGIGDTFISGALDAWLADEVGEAQLGPIYLRASQLGQGAGLAAIPVSVGLGNLQLNFPILVGAALFVVLAAFCWLRMPETSFQPVSVRDGAGSLRAVKQTLGDGLGAVRGRPILLTMLTIIGFQCMAEEGMDRLYTPHLLFEVGVPSGWGDVTWFGF